MRIAIIGMGNMGQAFASGLLKSFDAQSIVACDKHPEKLKNFTGTTTDSAERATEGASAVLLSVKPQSAAELLKELNLKDKLVISIMAGITLESLEKMTGSTKIVRAMPNLPASLGEGMTGWIATNDVTKSERELAEKMFSSVGKHIELKDESLLNVVTAVSGSGPAYVFLLCELLEKGAREMGLNETEARLLAQQTIIGSAELLSLKTRSAGEWRAAVTSKGGTTAAAIASLSNDNLEQIFLNALKAAQKRASELNQ